MEEPKVEELVAQLRKLQQEKLGLDQDIKEALSYRASLRKELESLESEAYQLEETYQEKEDSYRVLQFQCKESDQDRLLQHSKRSKELVEQYKCEIQENKLKHRKQRMKFQNQLHQLTELHKNLHSIYSPDRLGAEIESAENSRSQLLVAGELKLSQLHHLEELLAKVNKLQGTTAGEAQEE